MKGYADAVEKIFSFNNSNLVNSCTVMNKNLVFNKICITLRIRFSMKLCFATGRCLVIRDVRKYAWNISANARAHNGQPSTLHNSLKLPRRVLCFVRS